jgi:tRNA-splicing ligase RtcB
MNTTEIDARLLKDMGFAEGKALGEALKYAKSNLGLMSLELMVEQLDSVLDKPEEYISDELLSKVALALVDEKSSDVVMMKDTHEGYKVYGADYIEAGAIKQMEVAMKLPISVAGALMPDAHQGYGLPIGGVLAVNNAVIPYGVGVDIGCRMALSIFDISESFYLANENKFKRELIAFTKFGAGAGWHGNQKAEHAVLESGLFNINPFIKNLHAKASEQLGTSGGGNHFVEWGIIEMLQDDVKLGVPKGKYLALLSHSGSRGFGATVAAHYTKLAKDICKLPDEAKNLAYLSLDSEQGQEYWLAMNLAGDYASACHDVIHNRLAKAIGVTALARVENHHNFAWKEQLNGQEVVVHRKGATPAGKDVLGIIPGSMTAPGFLVRGKGEVESINSASHGAGRQMSRTQAIKTIRKTDWLEMLNEHGVTLIGAGLDEAPMAYKDINKVMHAQGNLVDVLAKFTPKMVRMAEDGSRED